METITIRDNEYILVENIFNKAPIYCKDSRNGRELIKNKKITDFIYAKIKEGVWIQSDGKSYKYDKILLKKSFVQTIKEIAEPSIIITDDKHYELAPDIIELENTEKFKDTNGNIYDIETRGERKVNNIYFKVKDVMTAFALENLITTILNINSVYKENEHYKYFNCKKNKNEQKITIKKELFLTYEGILRVLFASHSAKAKTFIKWATETLFTVCLGEQKEKEQLSATLLGVDVKNIKSAFSANSDKTPCVYLIMVGNANKLLKDEKYHENDIICKFGYTTDLVRRTNQHYKTYKKEFNVEIELLIFSIIDPQYVCQAETSISHYFNENKLTGYSIKDVLQTELIIINYNNINQIKEHYKLIQNSYIGHYKELNEKIITLEKELLIEKNSHEITKKNHELTQKELEYTKKEMEMSLKILNLEKNVLEMKLNNLSN